MRLEARRWQLFATKLGVQVATPFTLQMHGKIQTFDAHLPQFGSASGMVVDEVWSQIEPVRNALLEAGYSFSCVSLDDLTGEGALIDLLSDWGWNGTGQKPVWVKA